MLAYDVRTLLADTRRHDFPPSCCWVHLPLFFTPCKSLHLTTNQRVPAIDCHKLPSKSKIRYVRRNTTISSELWIMPVIPKQPTVTTTTTIMFVQPQQPLCLHQPQQPLCLHLLPSRPWQKIWVDKILSNISWLCHEIFLLGLLLQPVFCDN